MNSGPRRPASIPPGSRLIPGWALLLVLAARESPAQEPPSAATARAAAKRLSWEFDSRKSVEVRTQYEIVPAKIDPLTPAAYDMVEDHYIETALAQRKCDSRYLKSGKVVNRLTHLSDGTKCVNLTYSKEDPEQIASVVLKRQYFMEDRSDRMEPPEPLRLLYVGREPLHKALPKATYLGERSALGRGCDVFLFARVRWEVRQDHVYYLDKATSIPLRVEAYRDQAARDAQKPLWVWSAGSLDQVQDHFIPLRSTMIAYSEDSKPDFTWNYHVLSIEFDRDYPASIFTPGLPPGATVVDTISDKMFKVPDPKAKDQLTVPAAEGAESATTDRTIEAVPPGSWTAAISTSVIGIGGVVLIAGGILWWRRH